MASSSNGVFPDGNSNKRPLENGYHSSFSNGFQPKYKWRKVSAVRDFPPGCGRNMLQVNLNSQENGVVSNGDIMPIVRETDYVKSSETNVGSQVLEVVGSPAQVEMDEALDDLVGRVVAAVGMVNVVADEELGADVKSLGIELPEGLENNSVRLSNELHQSEGQVLVKELNEVGADVKPLGIELLEGMENNSVGLSIELHQSEGNVLVEESNEAGADVKPLEIELPKGVENKSLKLSNELHQSEGQVLVKESNEVEGLAFVQESGVLEGLAMLKSDGAEDKKPVLEIGAFADGVVQGGGAKSWSPPQWPINDGKGVNETALSPKNKYRRRRVSATRDFPRFCGRNAPRPTEEDRLRILGETLRGGVEGRSEALKAGVESESVKEAFRTVTKELDNDIIDGYSEKSEFKGNVPVSISKYKAVIRKGNKDASGPVGEVGKERMAYSQDINIKRRTLGDDFGSGHEVDRVMVQGLMAAPCCPWMQGKGSLPSSDCVMSRGQVKKHDFTARQKSKLVNMKEKSVTATKATSESTSALAARDEGELVAHYDKKVKKSPAGQMPNEIDVSLPPFGPNSSNHGDARNKVRETLRLFQAICRKLLHGEEVKSRQGQDTKLKQKEKKGNSRIDLLATDIIKRKGKEVNTGKHFLGAVPGVEVGDEFQYRVELAIIGIHRLYQNGIDVMKLDGVQVAASIVASGRYADDMDNADALIYSGQGGNGMGKNKKPEDQKLERGNLALKNSISVRNPVRVIRGSKETKASDSLDARTKVVTSYVYDGLYTVEKCWTDTGAHGKLVFMFELTRIPGQPELAWRELKKSKKYKIREGLCVDDISGGKESFPISAVNTIDDEKPPSFNYTTTMIYCDWYRSIPPKGCDCKGRCSDSPKCSCAVKNGGEIPYNNNGAIVEPMALVYECGPSCKCPPSCYNKVTQHGIKIQLEIFKTESRGWGVRSPTFIPSGSFICEYVGELLEDKEAEQRIDSDEYLFDIGQNYNDCSNMPDAQSHLSEALENGGYTIDAARYGNVGRFVNHSCSPNLYAQNVLYDNEDNRIPHIMLFAAENIPPLQELTYHYNYSVDQVRDSNGNIKMKSCYCGSAECTGRMY